MESRKHDLSGARRKIASSELPADFTNMISEVFRTNFEPGLKLLQAESGREPSFQAAGVILPDEIVVSIALLQEGQISATTVHCSVDFDPKASTPKAQDLLNICVDAIGAFFGQFLDPEAPERISALASESLSSLEDIPFEWTKIDFEKRAIWLRVDKANPALEAMTEKWLAENDPDIAEEDEELEEKSKDLFVTGEKAKRSGRTH